MLDFEAFDEPFTQANVARCIELIDEFARTHDDGVNGLIEDEPLVYYLAYLLKDDETTGREEVFSYLASKGCNLDAAQMSRSNALGQLAFSGNLHYFKVLVDLGANINLAPEQGESPIVRAVRSNYSERVMEYILSHPRFEAPKVGALTEIAKRSGSKNSAAVLKKLKIR
jgi:hypothetical protein